MSKTLWLDTESFSECDLKKAGVYVYAAHPSTEVVLFSYAFHDDAPRCWDVNAGEPMPDDLSDALFDPTVTVIARNAAFDRALLRGVMGIDIPISRWQCAMVMALCHALPGSLAESNKALGMSVDFSKLADGHKLVMKFCKPAPKNHKLRRYTRDTHPIEWARYVDYCNQDVSAMRHEWNLIPNMNYNAAEIALWHLDQAINDRGFQADVELAHAGAAAADVEKTILGERLRFLTNEIVAGPTKREALLAYLNAVCKLGLDDLTKNTLEQRLKQGNLDPVCREIMEVRLAANKTSTAKYAALVTALGVDGRFRGGLQFAGAARTRRFAGRIFQPQNLPSRGLPKADVIEGYIGALKAGTHDLIYDDLMLLGAASLRGLVIAPPGKKLVVADLSNIEGRILAWVAGEGWKLKAFREYDDGIGPDLYNITATSIIGGDPWKVSKTNRNVFGKVPDLACFASDVLVLTSTGFTAIGAVLPTDLLWDGVEWTTHNGVIAKGVRPVVKVDGIEVTPDHLIRTGETWTPAQELVSNQNTLSQALATGSANLPSSVQFSAPPGVSSNGSTNSKPVYDISQAGPRNRFTVVTDSGFLIVHNCGYRGGVPGFQTFAHSYNVRMAGYWPTIQANIAEAHILRAQDSVSQPWAVAQINNLGISEAEWIASETVKLAWRARHPATVQLWKDIQEAAIAATRNPGTVYVCGKLQVLARTSKAGHLWLYIKLPSGKHLTYFEPRVSPSDYGDRLTYMGLASEDGKTGSRAWCRTYTHGGKLTGNCCIAADTQVLTARGLVRVVDVTARDQVWDGVEWVFTDGLIDKGIQEVGVWKGILITQAHLVHDGGSWKPVIALGEFGSDAALSWGHASAPSWWSALASATTAPRRAAAIVRGKLRFLRGHFSAGKRCAAVPAAGSLPGRNVGRCSVSQAPSCATHGHPATPTWWRAALTPIIQPTLTTVAEASRYVANGWQIAALSSATSVASPGTIAPDSIWTAETTNGATNQATSGSLPGKSTHGTGGATTGFRSEERRSPWWSFASAICRIGQALKQRTTTLRRVGPQSGSWQSTTKAENVFDLLNCGPRNRFTVLTDSGFAILHNCQTLAGDLLKENMPAIEAAGYKIVLSVHDEIIAETPDTPEYSAEHLAALLSANPAWAGGLPLAAAGFETYRYAKQ